MPTAELSWPLPIQRAAALAGGWAWAEGRLYEQVGAWARLPGGDRCRLFFDSASQHHAWRAGLWRERLPGRLVESPGNDLPGAPPGPLGPPSPAAEAAVATLSRPRGDAGRLSAYCRVVLPRVISAYRAWYSATSPSADRPVARALSMALADALGDWQEGTALLLEVLDEGGEAALAEASQAAEEADRAFMSWRGW